MIGFNWYSNVYTSNSIGAVTGRDYVGGLIGLSGCDISESYSSGAVSGRNYVGGLIGKSYDSLSNTYSIGSVTGTSYVGGLVGSNYGPISNSYSTGAVAGTTNIGGLVGSNSSVVTASFWDVNTSGQTHSAGSADTYGKSTADMKTLATFTAAGWDIDGTIGATGTIWRMKDGVTYPLLRLFDPNTITGFTAPSITAVATAPTSHNLDVYDLLKNKSGVMTEGGNPGGGLLAQQTPHFEIDPSVFSNE